MALQRQVKALDESTRDVVRSSIVISALHILTEELIQNSLDACSNDIEVIVDFRKDSFALQVSDNGHGIPFAVLQTYCGSRYHSTKPGNAGSTYGFKGEALASVNIMGDTDIFSKTAGSPIVYHKNLKLDEVDQARCPLKQFHEFNSSGTIITIKRIFANYPVRFQSTKPSYEISRIKEFIQNMSLLHHRISWTLIDKVSNKCLCRLPSQISIGARFISLHSQAIFCKMKVKKLIF
jgi:DNA mismatch repair protein MLH3